jgi:hypothetical protein
VARESCDRVTKEPVASCRPALGDFVRYGGTYTKVRTYKRDVGPRYVLLTHDSSDTKESPSSF